MNLYKGRGFGSLLSDLQPLAQKQDPAKVKLFAMFPLKNHPSKISPAPKGDAIIVKKSTGKSEAPKRRIDPGARP